LDAPENCAHFAARLANVHMSMAVFAPLLSAAAPLCHTA
jgi:hypothetical protein